jgi:DeoR/GlpR family transcriptional regulator of sugar metabolism
MCNLHKIGLQLVISLEKDICNASVASKEVTMKDEENKKHKETKEPGTAGTYFETREQLQMVAKRSVAKKIVTKLLHEGDSILLDAGTSSYPIALEIAEKAQQDPGHTHYTIMTHNYMAFDIVVKQVPREAMCNILLTGGRYDVDLNALFGLQTIKSYEGFHPKVVLLAVSALEADTGLYCHGNTEEFPVKEIIFGKRAIDRIIVADHTKLGMPDALCFGQTSKLRANVENCILVTDEPHKEDGPGAKEKFEKAKERFEKERKTLTGTYGIKIEIAEI